jgi:hypothetical protein
MACLPRMLQSNSTPEERVPCRLTSTRRHTRDYLDQDVSRPSREMAPDDMEALVAWLKVWISIRLRQQVRYRD